MIKGFRKVDMKGKLESVFLSGLLMGFGAMSLLYNPSFRPTKRKDDNTASDWQAVGRDLACALHRYNDIHPL